jgi:hypothetical protein
VIAQSSACEDQASPAIRPGKIALRGSGCQALSDKRWLLAGAAASALPPPQDCPAPASRLALSASAFLAWLPTFAAWLCCVVVYLASWLGCPAILAGSLCWHGWWQLFACFAAWPARCWRAQHSQALDGPVLKVDPCLLSAQAQSKTWLCCPPRLPPESIHGQQAGRAAWPCFESPPDQPVLTADGRTGNRQGR